MRERQWPVHWRSTTAGVTCPSCGERAGRPILFGMPTVDVFEAQEAGQIDIAIGGCCVTQDGPTHRCSICGSDFIDRSLTNE